MTAWHEIEAKWGGRCWWGTDPVFLRGEMESARCRQVDVSPPNRYAADEVCCGGGSWRDIHFDTVYYPEALLLFLKAAHVFPVCLSCIDCRGRRGCRSKSRCLGVFFVKKKKKMCRKGRLRTRTYVHAWMLSNRGVKLFFLDERRSLKKRLGPQGDCRFFFKKGSKQKGWEKDEKVK